MPPARVARLGLTAALFAGIVLAPTLASAQTLREGWVRFEPRPLSDAAPEPELAPATTWPGAPNHEVSVRARLLRLGLPRVERAELRDVLVRGNSWRPTARERRRALVEPARDGGAPWALHERLLRPVEEMGPLLDLEEECEAAVALHEQAALETTGHRYDLEHWAREQCPLEDAWPVLAERGRSDLVERYFRVAPKNGIHYLVFHQLGGWLFALLQQARWQHAAGLDRLARRGVAVFERAVVLGEDLEVLSREQHFPELAGLRAELETSTRPLLAPILAASATRAGR